MAPLPIPENEYELVEGQKLATKTNDNDITLSWSDISYTVQNDKETKVILHQMNGVAYPGELLAIMGTSGAGKSTLLDVLAGRIVSKDLTGSIMTNNKQMDKDVFRKKSGYVMQSDALFPLLTVRETIQYAAQLRCTGTSEEKNNFAETTIKLLKLEDCADTIVGDNDNRGLSGGQKRRVSVAVDIIHSPSVIFLDEPTSGLDSSTALSVVESLKELASTRGCTIIMTIHQPSARLFNLIDKVLFLANGRVTYNGIIKNLTPFIKDIYEQAKLGEIPTGNQPEIFLDLCDQLIKENRLDLVTSKYESHDTTVAVSDISTDITLSFVNSFFKEVFILAHRGQLNVRRTPELFIARLGASTGFGVMIGTLFLFTEDTITGLQHRLSYFVFIVAFFYYTSLEALPIFLQEREIFQREYSRGAYRAISYTVSSTIVSWPFMLFVAVWFSCITYWLVGLPNLASIFFFHVFTVFTILVAGSSFATAMSTVIPNAMTGQTAGSALLSVMFLFSGFFIKTNDIPDYWIWLHYLSLFKYAFDSLIINDLHGVTVEENGVTILDNEAVLKMFDKNGINYARGVGILWLFIIAFRVVFWYRLKTAFNGSRK